MAISNSLFSFIAGFAVFATLGYQMNLINEKAAVDDTVEPIESVSQLNVRIIRCYLPCDQH